MLGAFLAPALEALARVHANGRQWPHQVRPLSLLKERSNGLTRCSRQFLTRVARCWDRPPRQGAVRQGVCVTTTVQPPAGPARDRTDRAPARPAASPCAGPAPHRARAASSLALFPLQLRRRRLLQRTCPSRAQGWSPCSGRTGDPCWGFPGWPAPADLTGRVPAR